MSSPKRNRKISTLLIKLPKKDKERFKVKCVKEGKSMSEKIRNYIKELE